MQLIGMLFVILETITTMKKIIILFTLVLGSASYAQQTTTVTTTTTTVVAPSIIDKKHEVKLGAIKLLSGGILEGTYEYIKTKDFTYGASLLYNFEGDASDFPEKFSVTPFVRFYFQESKEYGAKGFLVEGFGKFSTGNQFDYYYDDVSYEEHETKTSYSAGALGLSLGWKWVNHTGFVFEILAGGGRTLAGNNSAPDGFFRGDLNVGYRF
jgi:hypothetical protein